MKVVVRYLRIVNSLRIINFQYVHISLKENVVFPETMFILTNIYPNKIVRRLRAVTVPIERHIIMVIIVMLLISMIRNYRITMIALTCSKSSLYFLQTSEIAKAVVYQNAEATANLVIPNT